jgi:hypothetical protein
MVKILSFDIGIKNLAYCLLENTDINGDSSILDWGIIDLINDTPLIQNIDKDKNKDNSCICSFIQKNKKICGKTGYCQYKENDDILCKTHSKKYVDDQIDIIEKVVKKKVVKKKCNTKSSRDICITLIEKLNEKPHFIECDYIVIENQPSTKNPTMKTIQVMIYTYFINKCYIDNKCQHIKDIVLLAPRNKLTVYTGPVVECNLKNKYSRTKKLGIEYCKYMIQTDIQNTQLFISHTKKDDLADCYLQGVFFIKNNLKKYK